MRRLKPTLIDYMVVAINPALIMVLIGSLVYFLLEMFYQGQYPERLHYCLSLYIFSSVLVARISMEDGWEHAAPFGIALAVAICLALHRFVNYRGTQLEDYGWILNYALIGLIMWCAAKLTWDCTLMDETQDASGEGLLQTAGLDSGKPEPAVSGNTPATGAAESQTETILADKEKSHESETWFARFVRWRRRPHAAGLWIVYFSLVALPLFGLGQASIPLANTASRQYSFVLLCVYVASALALLLTTSFLGLRRYLRQRRLEMPAPMAATWLVTGAVLIVSMLCLTAFLPRSNAEYAISQLPTAFNSEQGDTSKVALGSEGKRDEQAKSGQGQESRPNEKDNQTNDSKDQEAGKGKSQGKPGGGNNSGKQSSSQKSSDEKSDNSKSDNSQSSDSKSGESKSGQSKSDSKSGDSKQSNSKTSDSKQGESKSNSSSSAKSDSSQSKQGDSKQTDAKQSAAKSGDAKSRQANVAPPKRIETKPEKSTSGSGSSSGSKSWRPEGMPPPPNVALAAKLVADLFKYIFYAALAGFALWWLFFHWRLLLEWWAALVNNLAELWRRLFGRGKEDGEEELEAPQRRHFADFSDPFAAGIAGRYPPVELVRYTFEALEAWARDNGCPREADRTVYEFAHQIGVRVPALAAPSRTLADLYSWAAYAPRTLPASCLDALREFWQALLRAEATRGQQAAAVANESDWLAEISK